MFTKVIAALMLTSSFAFAYPTVGDKVMWTGEEEKLDGTKTPMSASKEVTMWDTESHMWTIKVDKTKGEETTTEEVKTKCLWSPEDWQMLMAKCEEKGGTLEDVGVIAGTFPSCRMTVTADDGRVIKTWMGDVPFGLIKKEITNVGEGSKTTMEIESITNGVPTPVPEPEPGT
ncbi:hypothetical protein [Bdellovibrio sp. HCB209]|uniref:hypothetical protein n=1 Tax=Bdellovibrio sp. HCB209 TaxID=3394354 RepID=UPI0039B62647